MMRGVLLVALGGALGSVARFAIGNTVHALWPMRFPLATLGVNAIGSLLIGVIYVLIAERAVLHPEWRSIVMVGVLGGFTTFSTFSLETVTLLEHGLGAHALAYVLASLLLCIGGAWLGMGLARMAWSI